MPWIGLKEDPLPVPASISEAVLAEHNKKKG
jgi:ubiquinol-cytochrome c reductase cytochrome b subunit